jgi:aerobic C4-dicarboxylate transport protein
MIFKELYVQVLCAIAIGGYFQPDVAQQMKPLGDLFVKLIKMMIAPIIFATVVLGVAKMGSMTEVGRVRFKALLYFETVTSVALVLGLVVVKLWKPGAGLNIDPATLDAKSIASFTSGAQHLSTIDFLLNIVPDSQVLCLCRASRGIDRGPSRLGGCHQTASRRAQCCRATG